MDQRRLTGLVEAPPAWVSLQQVSCLLGTQWALREISLSIQPGERIALVGANGSGKTTLLRLLQGLIQPTHGVLLRPLPLAQALVFQRPHMLRASVLQQLTLAVWLAGHSWRSAKHHAMHTLQQMGLQPLAQQHAHTLSGGQQQRLALAMAWARQPQVLLLDEPTASLDPGGKRELEALIAQCVQAKDAPSVPVTLVLSSHNLGQAKRLSSRVIYLEQGQLCADLPTEQFFNSDLSVSHPQAHGFLRGELG